MNKILEWYDDLAWWKKVLLVVPIAVLCFFAVLFVSPFGGGSREVSKEVKKNTDKKLTAAGKNLTRMKKKISKVDKKIQKAVAEREKIERKMEDVYEAIDNANSFDAVDHIRESNR